jgi:hypothetical protein
MSHSTDDAVGLPPINHDVVDQGNNMPDSSRVARKRKYTLDELLEGHVPGPLSEEMRAWENSPAVGHEIL